MKTNVVFYSKTGHSRKIAEAIGKELNVTPKSIKPELQLEETDLLFLVGGIYGGKCSPEIVQFASELTNNKIVNAVLVTSCMSNKQGQDEVRKTLEKNGINVFKNEYICKGSFLFFGMGHPSIEEVENAALFAKRTASQL
ncbi:flavodoxin domain-containing protein [Alkalibacter mobilis]|uniref:flavodoxin domain-containing protein n=1 Tax=Alkalibacter mobilis TaxID=2787712 RepID=UPI00189CA3A4|nr:flavodoxin domain-containing protein [Alkalibacter mobilis]MBF7095706.1 hypothetical protein [Alkalibacter mobilis]